MSNWSLQPILDSYLAVAVLAAGLVLALWVGPNFRQLETRRRRTLLVLRILVTILVIVLMLRPTHISTQSKSQSAELIVLADVSRSMQLPSASGNQSRWEAQVQTLRQIAPLLQQLEENLEIKVLGYDAHLQPALWKDKQLALPAAPDGRETDIGTSLHEAIQQDAGKRLAGVILMGDGTQTAFQPAVEMYDAARELGHRGYPLYTVSYGPAGDATQARDVAVENLPEQYTIFVKNELAVRGLVRIRGYVNQEIPVRLVIEDSAGAKQEIGPSSVQADQDNQQVEVEFTYVPQTPGQYKLTLEVDEQPGELVTKNNQLTAFLTVLEGGLRVLYLEGELRYEQKFICWALDNSPDIDLDFQWFPARLRKEWPVSLGDTLQKGNYDAYILGDLDSAALGEENLKQLAAEVEKGKGLIVLGGYHSFGPGGYRTTPLANVLPVEMDRLARQEFGSPDVQQWHIPGPLQMLPTRPHPVTLLASAADNLRVWRELKPLKGANRWADVKQVPGIQILAVSQNDDPLLVAGEYGRGRVLAFAGDSTWQWWMRGMSTLHRRFWRQVILWLARRDDLTRNDIWIDMPQRRFAAGSRVAFTTGARTAMGDVIPDAQLTAHLVATGKQAVPIPLSATEGEFRGLLDRISEPGSYQISVVATDKAGQQLGIATANLEVLDQDVELSNPAADPDQMERLASLTRQSGGRAVAPEQLPALLEEIRQNPPQMVEEVLTRWQLADTTWDAWLVLSCLVALLGVEWFLRKRWGLV